MQQKCPHLEEKYESYAYSEQKIYSFCVQMKGLGVYYDCAEKGRKEGRERGRKGEKPRKEEGKEEN